MFRNINLYNVTRVFFHFCLTLSITKAKGEHLNYNEELLGLLPYFPLLLLFFLKKSVMKSCREVLRLVHIFFLIVSLSTCAISKQLNLLCNYISAVTYSVSPIPFYNLLRTYVECFIIVSAVKLSHGEKITQGR